MDKERFVVSFKLKTSNVDEDILSKRFEIARHIYNSVLNVSLKRYNELIKTKDYRANQENIKSIYSTHADKDIRKELCKPYFKIKNDMLKAYGLTEYELHKVVAPMQRHFRENIDSLTAQKIASRVWAGFVDLLFGDGEKLSFKKHYQGLNSVEGKNNKSGIRYKGSENILYWLGLKLVPQIDINNRYEVDALRARTCYVRIVRKFVRGKYKYSMQLILDGKPPRKNRSMGKGRLGIDIGTQTIGYVSDKDAKLLELAPSVVNIEKEKRRVQRYMDRSKRATNPNNFNEDGTIKRGIKLKWNFSNKYKKARSKLRELHRKQKDVRRLSHNILANEIIKEANVVLVETMNFKALQKRAKKTTKNKKTGKYNSKKRFGRSLANKAPAMLIEIIENKLKFMGGELLKVNTRVVKASQYNHLSKKYSKKKLSQRWNNFNYNSKKIKVQRDLYSAYLIKNVEDDLESIDNDKCSKDFGKFLKLHDKEIERLSSRDNLSSMGVKKAI